MATQLQNDQPLPANPYHRHTNPGWHDAYNVCLEFQTGQQQQRVKVRVLGYLIIEAPVAEGRDYVCNEILSCERDLQKLLVIAEKYTFLFLRLCELTNSASTRVVTYG